MVLRFSSTGSSKKALLTAFSNALAINRGTGCPKSSSLKFHAEYLLIKTLFLHEIARRCLFLYQVQVFRISVTGMPFLFCFVLFCFFITFCSRCGMKWDTACRPTNDPFELFYHLVRGIQFNPQTIFV